MRLAHLIGPDLLTLVQEAPDQLSELLDEIHPEDIADVVLEFPDEQAVALLTLLPAEYAAQVLSRLPQDRQEQLAERMGAGSVARIATEMGADDRADFFSILPPSVGEPAFEELELLNPEAAEEVEELQRWPEKTAGGLMTTDYISVGPNVRIDEAIDVIRKNAGAAESLEVIYVVDDDHRLLGFLKLRNLLTSQADERARDVMLENVISVPPEQDQEEVAKVLAKYDLHTMPVVDRDRHMLGVITSDDILDVMAEEQAEDVQKMGAI